MSAPMYRYLELPEPDYSNLARGIRWGLVFAAPLWLVIFAAGFLIAHFT